MKKIIILITMFVLSIAVASSLNHQPVYADGDGSCSYSTPLGFRPWYAGLDCVDGSVTLGNDSEIPKNIWRVVLNILSCLLVAVGYLSVGFIIYGGYLYVLSQGSSDVMTKAKKTLTNAIIGLVIAILANVIVVTILNVLLGTQGGS